jgi:ParB-like chromosome segregation protein Spo0J
MTPTGENMTRTRRQAQPLDEVTWVPRDSIKPNEYNPNQVPPPELRLLKVSIFEDGWTQPIVVHRPTRVIVDGEHRWTVAGDLEILALTA